MIILKWNKRILRMYFQHFNRYVVRMMHHILTTKSFKIDVFVNHKL